MTDINHAHKYLIILIRITPRCAIQREGQLSLLTERQYTKTVTWVCSSISVFCVINHHNTIPGGTAQSV